MIGPTATLAGTHADPLSDQSEWAELIPCEVKVAMLAACATASRALAVMCGIEPKHFVADMCAIAAQSLNYVGVLPMDSREL